VLSGSLQSLGKHITIVQGHPDSAMEHFGNALAAAYRDGADAAGHDVKCIDVAKLGFSVLRSAEEL
jgi:putative NADPH-quinone reductase